MFLFCHVFGSPCKVMSRSWCVMRFKINLRRAKIPWGQSEPMLSSLYSYFQLVKFLIETRCSHSTTVSTVSSFIFCLLRCSLPSSGSQSCFHHYNYSLTLCSCTFEYLEWRITCRGAADPLSEWRLPQQNYERERANSSPCCVTNSLPGFHLNILESSNVGKVISSAHKIVSN